MIENAPNASSPAYSAYSAYSVYAALASLMMYFAVELGLPRIASKMRCTVLEYSIAHALADIMKWKVRGASAASVKSWKAWASGEGWCETATLSEEEAMRIAKRISRAVSGVVLADISDDKTRSSVLAADGLRPERLLRLTRECLPAQLQGSVTGDTLYVTCTSTSTAPQRPDSIKRRFSRLVKYSPGKVRDAIRRISEHVPDGKLEWVPALAVLGITFQVSKRQKANQNEEKKKNQNEEKKKKF